MPTGTQVWIIIIIAAARCVFILGILMSALGIANCLSALSNDPGNLTAIRLVFQYGATLIQLAIAQFLLKLIHHWFTSAWANTYWQTLVDSFKKAYDAKRESK